MSRAETLVVLTNVSAGLTRVNSSHDVLNRYRSYCEWIAESVRLLRSRLHGHELDSLITTRRYWALQASAFPDQPSLGVLLNLELDERRRELDDACSALRTELAAWVGDSELIVPDTGVFLRHRDKWDEIDWIGMCGQEKVSAAIVIPMTVVDQLDGRKREHGHIGWRAGYTLAVIERLFSGSSQPFDLEPLIVSSTRVGGTAMNPHTLAATARLLPDRAGHLRLSTADEEIVARAVDTQATADRRVRLVTFDTGMSLRAQQAGLVVHKLTDADLSDEARPRPYQPKR